MAQLRLQPGAAAVAEKSVSTFCHLQPLDGLPAVETGGLCFPTRSPARGGHVPVVPPPNLQDRDPVVLCVGTIGGRKAQPDLAGAFARIAGRHPEWQLRFIGRPEDPADVDRIRSGASKAGISDRVHLLGRLSDEETLHQMQRASIIAMPSLQEGLGLSLQEALFHGCVGVGSRVGGIPELIEHEVNGLLVPPGDVAALSAALDRLMSDPALLDRFRAQSRASILRKGMTSAAMVQNYLDLYQKFLPAPRLA
jgi:glycosyltransferase involved in cell wall biosynthesis